MRFAVLLSLSILTLAAAAEPAVIQVLEDPQATSYTTATLSAGSKCFAVDAFNEIGVHSALSNMDGKDLQGPGTATISWQAPVLNTDETPLDDLAGFAIWANDGPCSEWPGYVPPIEPQPPTNLQVVETTAYIVTFSRDFIARFDVGTVPVGTECVHEQRVKPLLSEELTMVPVSAVELYPDSDAQLEVAFALCAGD